MRIYTIHLRGPEDEPVLVAEGFSWPAFLAGPLWPLGHGMMIWAAAVGLVLLVLELIGLAAGLAGPSLVWLYFGFALGFGLVANDLRRTALARGGHREAGVVGAADRDAALQRFLDLYGQAARGG